MARTYTEEIAGTNLTLKVEELMGDDGEFGYSTFTVERGTRSTYADLIVTVTVEAPHFDEHYQRAEDADVTIRGFKYSGLPAHEAAAAGAAIVLAGQFAAVLDQCTDFADQKAAAQRAEEERQAARDRRAAWLTEMAEAVQWYFGQPMRLRRTGRKSPIMGTVDDVRHTYLHITTERHEPMDIPLAELTLLEIKYEGDRQYTRIELPENPNAS